MRYLLLSSCIFILAGCSYVYKNLQSVTGDANAIEKFKPDFRVALYKAEVDVVGHHLSGLLLIKTLQDSSVRMVFSNEVGFKFFDFEFRPDGDFKVHYIVKQMNKKAVIKTLKKDFELIMMRQQDIRSAYIKADSAHLYYLIKRPKGFFCYVTNKTGNTLERMEISSPHKPIIEGMMKDYKNGIPDTINITHKNFGFTIGLKQIER